MQFQSIRKILLSGGALVASAVLVAACSGGGGGGGGASVSTGTYTVTNPGLSPNTCFAGATSFYDGMAPVDIVVAADGLSMTADVGFSTTYDINGTALHDPSSPGSETIACMTTDGNGSFGCYNEFLNIQQDRAFAATITKSTEYEGTITGKDKLTFNDEYSYSCTGADCTIVAGSAGIPFPCGTSDHGDLAK